MKNLVTPSLAAALARRKTLPEWQAREPLRIFHGPGDGALPIAIDWFPGARPSEPTLAWVTEWAGETNLPESEHKTVTDFLEESGADVVAWLMRPPRGLPAPAVIKWARTPEIAEKGETVTREQGILYRIAWMDMRHPGLFLDHAPLRKILAQPHDQKRVLNLFSYTASLSLASFAGLSKKEKEVDVVSVDLSKATQTT